MPSLRLLFPVAALAALTASAAAAQIQDDLRPELAASGMREPGPPRRGCGMMRDPRVLPSLASMTDSAAFMRQLAAYAASYPIRGDSTPYALYSITVGATGRLEPPRPLAYLLPAGQEQALSLLVRDALRPEEMRPGTVRLRVTVAAAPVVAVERSQRCAPELRTRFGLESSALGAGTQRPQPARVRALVGADGRVLGVQLLGTTGRPELDRWIQDTLQRNRAVPGLIDGQPAQMEVEETIQISTRG